tara:strand:- start:86 stop:526 length:441 start_codon:yes stop_codon:yes gene_type:complete
MNPYIYVALASMSPVLELRGAIPLGLGLHLDLFTLMLVAVLANILIIPLSFLVLKFAKFREILFRILGERIEKKIARHRARFETFGELALIPFVAIPLPFSGAYTGILLAEVLGYNRVKSGLAIAIGVLIAAAIVMLASIGVISLW